MEKSYPDSYLVHYPQMHVNDERAEMLQEDVDRLDEYSGSVPTGVYLGKCWKMVTGDGVFLRWYGWSSDPSKAAINTRPIRVVTKAHRIAASELRRLEEDTSGARS
jgi:hypothetical protein